MENREKESIRSAWYDIHAIGAYKDNEDQCGNVEDNRREGYSKISNIMFTTDMAIDMSLSV